MQHNETLHAIIDAWIFHLFGFEYLYWKRAQFSDKVGCGEKRDQNAGIHGVSFFILYTIYLLISYILI